MNEATEFLVSMARAVGAMSLYEEGHPAREGALDLSYESLLLFQELQPTALFSFLEEFTLLGRRPVPSLQNWDWGQKLWEVGIQRLELLGPVSKEELEEFLHEALARMTGAPSPTSEARQTRETNLRYGALAVRSTGEESSDQPELLTFSLKEESEAVDWIHGELREGGPLQLVEAETVVRSLARAMHGDQDYFVPLLRLKQYDQYTTTHAMNVSVLAMALSEAIGLDPSAVRAFGIAGLLHDLGKVTIPQEILNKKGRLTRGERLAMKHHPAAGARLILESHNNLDLAAVVAYEHHIKLDGTGYPTPKQPRPCHQASDLVHVCDVFDALRTNRPYREAWEMGRVLRYLERGAGREFDPELTRAFVRMMRLHHHRVAEASAPDETLLVLATADDGDPGTESGTESPPQDLPARA